MLKYGWKVNVAFWNRNEFSNDWKLYIGIPVLKTEGSRTIYLRLTKRIMEIQPKLSIDIDDIVLISSYDSIAKEIRKKLVPQTSIDGQTKTLYLEGNERINGEAICYKIQKMKKNMN